MLFLFTYVHRILHQINCFMQEKSQGIAKKLRGENCIVGHPLALLERVVSHSLDSQKSWDTKQVLPSPQFQCW